MPLVMGVDSSTQSTKVEVRDADDGRVVAEGRAPHPPTTPPKSEQDPRAWWTAFDAARDAAGIEHVDAVSVAGQQHGLVVLDADGAPLRPAKLWNDTESAADAAWLVDQLGGPAAWAGACGVVPVAAVTITKLSWLHRTEPETFSRIAQVVLPHDYLTARLTGEYVTDRGDASGTGYYSAAASQYRIDLLEIVDRDLDWASLLPEVLAPTESRPARDGNALVAAGTGDNMAAALGIALEPGDVAISIGTSGTAYAVSPRPTVDPTGAVASFADATGRFLPLVCTLNATKVTDAIARLLGVDHAALDALALEAPAGAGGVVLLPYFDGERTPNRPDATGTIAGLHSDVAASQLARAAFEGVVCGLLDAVDALAAAGVEVGGKVVLAGGGTRSRAYQQIVADLTGTAVAVPHANEHVAAGACVQAAAALHGREPFDVARAWGLGAATFVEPNRGVDGDEIRSRYAAVRDAPVAATG
jgi:xylulokinase